MTDDAFSAHLGGLWRRVEEDGTDIGLPTDERHLNRDGRVGDVLLMLADHTMGTALYADEQDNKQATIQFDLQFVDAPGAGAFLKARGHVCRRGRSIAFMVVEIMVRDRLVATASGIWRVFATR